MRMFLVCCAEYPEEGSVEVEAWTHKGAKRRYRRATIGRGKPDNTPLGVCVASPKLLAMRKEGAL